MKPLVHAMALVVGLSLSAGACAPKSKSQVPVKPPSPCGALDPGFPAAAFAQAKAMCEEAAAYNRQLSFPRYPANYHYHFQEDAIEKKNQGRWKELTLEEQQAERVIEQAERSAALAEKSLEAHVQALELFIDSYRGVAGIRPDKMAIDRFFSENLDEHLQSLQVQIVRFRRGELFTLMKGAQMLRDFDPVHAPRFQSYLRAVAEAGFDLNNNENVRKFFSDDLIFAGVFITVRDRYPRIGQAIAAAVAASRPPEVSEQYGAYFFDIE